MMAQTHAASWIRPLRDSRRSCGLSRRLRRRPRRRRRVIVVICWGRTRNREKSVPKIRKFGWKCVDLTALERKWYNSRHYSSDGIRRQIIEVKRLKKMLKIMRQALCVLLGLNLVGCSCFMPWHQDVVVSGSPGDAEVRIKGEGTRRAGGVFSLRRDRDYSGSVVREGYQDEYFHISSQVNAMGVLDIIGGCVWLLPFVGLGFPGSHSLERDHYIYDLKPLE